VPITDGCAVVGDVVGVLVNGDGLTGERRFVDGEVGGEQAGGEEWALARQLQFNWRRTA
jgi:hypothetical protein